MSGKSKNKESTIIVPVRIDRKIFQCLTRWCGSGGGSAPWCLP